MKMLQEIYFSGGAEKFLVKLKSNQIKFGITLAVLSRRV